jgi:hypothetical protein
MMRTATVCAAGHCDGLTFILDGRVVGGMEDGQRKETLVALISEVTALTLDVGQD